jgi:para-nitrobenzyl esterase
MRKTLPGLVLVAVAAGALPTIMAPAFAADAPAPPAARAPAPAPAAAASGYSVSTTLVGKMLDDPAANAVLKKMIPTVYANEMFQSMGREITLKDIQQYEPEALSDANLAKLQAELDKLPAKR